MKGARRFSWEHFFSSDGLQNRRAWTAAALCLFLAVLASAAEAGAQEKRAVFNANDFHWQGNLKAGQTLEVINRNGDIDASPASDVAKVSAMKRDEGDDKELFIEVVEYTDGVTICAVYAKEQTPGRCHRGGVSSESGNWHGHHTKLNFDVAVPSGVQFKALTTNGGVHARDLKSV